MATLRLLVGLCCSAKPNILMFAVDDLRAEFGETYG